MNNKNADNSYLIPDRLSDVIRLILILAIDKYNFRTENGLINMLRGKPKSAETWLELAKNHQEFFRFNKEDNAIILLIRFLQMTDVEKGKLRPVLSVDQAQKLVDQAIELHDRQLARYQRDSAKTAIWAAYIAAGASLVCTLVMAWVGANANDDLKTDIKIIKDKLEHIINQ